MLALVLWMGICFRQYLQDLGFGRLLDLWVWVSNPFLAVGVLVVLLLVAMALFPGTLAPYDPEARADYLIEVDGHTYAAPFPPNPLFPLGSDLEARDLLSRVIFGTRRTLNIVFSVTLLRIAIGTVMGILVGWVGGTAGRLASMVSSTSATLPSLVFAFIIIAAIGPGAGYTVFVLGLGLTGWAPWTQAMSAEIRRIRTLGYMEAAEATGVPHSGRLLRHVLPNMLPLIIPNVAIEAGAAMLMLAELGFLGIFFGESIQINISDLLHQTAQPRTVEWAGMLAGTRAEVFRWYWLPLVPAGAFFVSILGFNLLADGLRGALDITRIQASSLTVRTLRRATSLLLGKQTERKWRGAVLPGRSQPSLRQRRVTPLATWALRVAVVAVVLLLVAGGTRLYNRGIQATRPIQKEEIGSLALLESAQDALRLSKFDLAEEQFRAILEQEPANEEALEGLLTAQRGRDLLIRLQEAKAFARAGEWVEALPLLRAIHDERPGYGGIDELIVQGEVSLRVVDNFEKAQTAYEAGNWLTAIAEYESVQVDDKFYEYKVVREHLFTSYLRRAANLVQANGQDSVALREALDLHERALAQNPADAETIAQRDVLQATLAARQAVEEGNWAWAISQLAGVWRDHPDLKDSNAARWLVKAYREMGALASDRGDVGRSQVFYDMAQKVAEQTGVESASLTVANLLETARTAQQEGDHATALAQYQAALDMLGEDPAAPDLLSGIEHPTSLFNLRLQIGDESAALEDWRRAATMYRQALVESGLAQQEGEDQPVARYYLDVGNASSEAGDDRSALEAYRLAVAAIQSGQQGLIYRVVAGDTLNVIAQRFSTTVQAIVDMNSITNPSLIDVGQELLIPVLEQQ